TAIQLEPNNGVFHFNLGLTLCRQGKFAAALASLKKGQELGSKEALLNVPTAKAIKQVERLLELERQLPAVLKGMEQPRDVPEQLGRAEMCYFTKHSASAPRLYAAVLERAPHPATTQHYTGACAAVLAAAGKSKDADKLD